MYIGAWTEYRLAQEQLQAKRRLKYNIDNNAAEPCCDVGAGSIEQPGVAVGGDRKGAGIYHPSLSDKGGTKVAGLIPDRESFRKVLKTALSSNLAADDAEQISQALEPLMQRLPMIHIAQPSPTINGRSRQHGGSTAVSALHRRGYRQQKRRDSWRDSSRYCTRGMRRIIVHTRSDAGTGKRSAGLSPRSHDGTRSTQSGFSAASAPTAVSATMAGSPRVLCGSRTGQHRRRSTPASSIQLPLIVDRPHRATAGSSNSSGTPDYGKPILGDCGARNTTEKAIRIVADDVAPSNHCDMDGGYDGSRAASMLRVARRRDPAGLKADFQQFWMWNNPELPSRDKQQQATTTAAAISEMGGAGTAGQQGARVRLETLARMKSVYMAKDNNVASATTDVVVPPTRNAPTSTSLLEAIPPIDAAVAVSEGKLVGSVDLEQERGRTEGTASVLPHFGEPVSVIVPDLELTESRIRQVEKYFGGAGRRLHLPAGVEGTTEVPVVSPEQQAAAVGFDWGKFFTTTTVVVIVVERGYVIVVIVGVRMAESGGGYPMGGGGGGGTDDRAGGVGDMVCCRSEAAPDAASRQQKQQQWKHGMDNNTVTTMTTSSRCTHEGGQSSAVEDSKYVTGADSSSTDEAAEREGNSIKKQRLWLDKKGEKTEKEREEEEEEEEEVGRGTKSPTTPVSAVVAPAWCGDSLEDLVCWTKGLDFDAAIEGF